jgi:3'(2'), 5'-bisphosphate nucleotidase
MRRGDIPGLGDGELDALTTIVSTAAAAILAARARPLAVTTKPDRSPVTAADRAAEEVILAGLAGEFPGTCVVSEEAMETARPHRLPDCFVLVDPLDGTRELVAGRDEFTINVAVVSGGRPRVGLVAAPAQGRVWRGIAGRGAERLELRPGVPARDAVRMPIRTRPAPPTGLVAAVSRSHLDRDTEDFVARLPVAQRLTCGSGVMFCLLA